MIDMAGSDSHPYWQAVVDLCGVIYFTAWSLSFYPQLILNYRRKSSRGLSPDFITANPLGFLALTLYNFSLYFSPLARSQYAARHDGHFPQVAAADLAFSLHALIISSITLLQVYYYHFRSQKDSGMGDDEATPLLVTAKVASPILASSSTVRPSPACLLLLLGVGIATLVSASLTWAGKTEYLDFLYFASSIKLVITLFKYFPQVFLNWRNQSVQGFAIGMAFMDLTGSVFSLLQLVISSLLAHDPGAIIANPAKLGLSNFSIIFDVIFLMQTYVLYPQRTIVDGEEENEDLEETI